MQNVVADMLQGYLGQFAAHNGFGEVRLIFVVIYYAYRYGRFPFLGGFYRIVDISLGVRPYEHVDAGGSFFRQYDGSVSLKSVDILYYRRRIGLLITIDLVVVFVVKRIAFFVGYFDKTIDYLVQRAVNVFKSKILLLSAHFDQHRYLSAAGIHKFDVFVGVRIGFVPIPVVFFHDGIGGR